MKINNKNRNLFLQLTVSFFLFWLILQKVDLNSVFNLLLGANISLLIAGASLAICDRALMIAKWYPLLTIQAPSVSIWRAARVYLASGFASFFLPSTVGGDMLRAFALGRGQKRVIEVGASITIERLIGMIASSLFIIMAIVFALRSEIHILQLLPWALLSLSLSLIVTLLSFSSHIRKWVLPYLGNRLFLLVERFVLAMQLYKHHLKTIYLFTLLSFIEQAMPILVMWMFSLSLGIDIEFRILFVAIPLVCFIARIPVSFNGLGLTEGASVYLLGIFGISPDKALALAIAGRIGDLVGLIPGALFWAELTGSKIDSAEQLSPEELSSKDQ